MFKRTLILAAVASLAMSSFARAADVLPVKAPSWASAVAYNSPCQVATASTPLSCSGLYVGAGLAGAGSNADIIGSGINGSVFAGGITPTLVTGYQYVQGNWIFAAEFDMGISVGTKAVVNGIGNGFNGMRLTEDFKVGGNLAGLFGTQTPLTIPASLANSVLGPYVHVGTAQWQFSGVWANGMVSGAGLLFDIGPHIFGDLRYTYTNFNGAKAGAITVNNDQALMVAISYKFK